MVFRFDAPDGSEGCWTWGGHIRPDGYGHLTSEGRSGSPHRVAYELFVGPIPKGLEIDHLCRNRACVNPRHLEAVTQLENWRRGESITRVNAQKDTCARGHPFDAANTYIRAEGFRQCRACNRVAVAEYNARKKAA